MLVLYSETGSLFHRELARRVSDALAEDGHGVELRSSRDMLWKEDEPQAETVLVAGPADFTGEGDAALLEAFKDRRRIALTSGNAEGEALSAFGGFEAVFELGFASRGGGSAGVPRHFVFNGPTAGEERSLAAPSKRPVPWAVFGRLRDERAAAVASELVALDPAGFVYMPAERLAAEGMLGPRALAAVASKTNYCIWVSEERGACGNYLRDVALGAVPCRVGESPPAMAGAPGAFSSVGELCAEMRAGNFRERHEEARRFWLSGGPLGENLREALARV